MAVQVSYPGVYIEEFAPGAPIQGVGTSTAAFLGPAADGPLNDPIKITSWDAFKREFGENPLDNTYLYYAVRGFFENGGRVCYVTNVSNASHDERVLLDTIGEETIRLSARTAGDLAPPITVTVTHTQMVAGGSLFRPTATINSSTETAITTTGAAEAARFRPGDVITINGTDTTIVTRVDGADIRISVPLAANNGEMLRLADLAAGDTTFRVAGGAGLRIGSVISLTQDPGGGNPEVTENAVVNNVLPEVLSPTETTHRVTLTAGLSNPYVLDPTANPTEIISFEWSLQVIGLDDEGDAYDETYENLSMRPEHPHYYRTTINNDENGIIFAAPVEPPNVTPPPDNRPAEIAVEALEGGVNGDPTTLGLPEYSNALSALAEIDDVNFIATPDTTDLAVQLAVIAHCQNLHDRFAILDAHRGLQLFGDDNSVELQRNALDTARGFAALYYPWLRVPPAAGTEPILVPPSGYVAGIYAR